MSEHNFYVSSTRRTIFRAVLVGGVTVEGVVMQIKDGTWGAEAAVWPQTPRHCKVFLSCTNLEAEAEAELVGFFRDLKAKIEEQLFPEPTQCPGIQRPSMSAAELARWKQDALDIYVQAKAGKSPSDVEVGMLNERLLRAIDALESA